MTVLFIVLGLLALLGLLAAYGVHRLNGMDSGEKKHLLKWSIRRIFETLEARRIIPRSAGFMPDYHRHYPKLKLLEDNYEVVRDECLKVLAIKDQITDISVLGGNYTSDGIHTIQWKSFMFKSGEFIEENCARCPQTAAILRQIPDVYTAFFSILDPKQYVTPHWGYYRGFLRYHLGVVIPNDNADGKCWLRVNDDLEDNASEEKERIANGEVYHWKNGEGVVFDDTYLHDAENGSDEIRVVLWLDMLKPMPFYVQWFNRLVVYFVHRDDSVKKIRRNALIAP